jgi:hypothetical protein
MYEAGGSIHGLDHRTRGRGATNVFFGAVKVVVEGIREIEVRGVNANITPWLRVDVARTGAAKIL